MQQIGGFLRVLQFPPPIKLKAMINWNIVESGVKHHNYNHHYVLTHIYFFLTVDVLVLQRQRVRKVLRHNWQATLQELVQDWVLNWDLLILEKNYADYLKHLFLYKWRRFVQLYCWFVWFMVLKAYRLSEFLFFLILKVANIRCFILIAVEIFHNIIRK